MCALLLSAECLNSSNTSNMRQVWYLFHSMITFPASSIIIIYMPSINPVALYNSINTEGWAPQ